MKNRSLSASLAIIVITLLSTTNTQTETYTINKKISQLKTSIHHMFSLFINEHQELEKKRDKILNKLDAYGHLLTDDKIKTYNNLVERMVDFKSYFLLSYNYSHFKALEKLPKPYPNKVYDCI